MKKITWISAIIVAIVVVLLLLLVIFGSTLVQEIDQSKHSHVHVGEIVGGRKVGQSFVSHHNNLARIEVFMATFGRLNTHDVIFHLRESLKGSKDLATVTVNASSILDNHFQGFSFPPIADSKGKSYYFFIESPKSVPKNAITVWFERNSKAYPEGSRFENDLPQSGDLAFKTYYRQILPILLW